MDAKKTGQLISESRKQHGMSQKDLADILNIFALVRYKHFDVHVFNEGKFLAPVVTWGKYEQVDERLIMPLAMNIHHAVADDFHLSRFFNEVQELMDLLQLEKCK